MWLACKCRNSFGGTTKREEVVQRISWRIIDVINKRLETITRTVNSIISQTSCVRGWWCGNALIFTWSRWDLFSNYYCVSFNLTIGQCKSLQTNWWYLPTNIPIDHPQQNNLWCRLIWFSKYACPYCIVIMFLLCNRCCLLANCETFIYRIRVGRAEQAIRCITSR